MAFIRPPLILGSIIIAALLFSCQQPPNQMNNIPSVEQKEESAKDTSWTYLFNGTTLEGWRAFNGDALPEKWVIENGMMTFNTELKLEKEHSGGNDIIYSKDTFGNFELYLEWKLPKGGNSGVMYHLKEGVGSMPEIGPEYQLLDDLGWETINNASLEEWQKAGADYAMHVPDTTKKILHPAGEWNSSRIVFTAERVEHWLNGKQLLSFIPWSEDWYDRKSKSKWKSAEFYGKFTSGYIGIQDHDSSLWFKNIKIRKL